ncbi:hypothetical protein [Sphaerisporangium dianthi]|uniref:Uncharacterized protein n=1 Tax=Sphaerisporangium dianthi TaxID=1436120 RepID=A0ABV9CQK7_9ACTN
MDVENWIALAGVVVALLSGVAAVAAVVFARSSAGHAKDSAQAGKDSAEAARKSAEEAATLSEIERDRRREERERRHEEIRPPHPGEIKGKLVKGGGRSSLYGSITVPRDYRVNAQAWYGNGYGPVDLPLLLRAHQTYDFCIEPWPALDAEPNTKEVRFRFWPPTEADDTEIWTCPCGGPTGEDPTNSKPHWELRVPLTLTRSRIRSF